MIRRFLKMRPPAFSFLEKVIESFCLTFPLRSKNSSPTSCLVYFPRMRRERAILFPNSLDMDSVFGQFTNQYSLSKTLRFELRPVGKTLESMKAHLGYDESLQTFLKDQAIESAYRTLKPVFDALHERFIGQSLETEVAKALDFSDYFTTYKDKGELKDIEKELRSALAKAYEETGKKWKEEAGKNEKGKDILAEKGFKILTERGILEYLKKNADQFSGIQPVEKIHEALAAFQGFFTYFGGFNTNRENYYETGKEAATAVATRIIHENLPKFCDNLILFEARKDDYESTYSFLEAKGVSLVDKENKPLHPIPSSLFQIGHFGQCLSQRQIEVYNAEIGNANFLINLYSQKRKDEAGFKKLPFLKTLYKQIGCGKRDALFFEITHDTRKQAEEARTKGEEAYSAEGVLALAAEAGTTYFSGKNDDGAVNTVPELIDYLKTREDYSGFYWSKMAINTVSDKYFQNWHELKEKLRASKVFEKAKKGSEDETKIPEAVELEGLFNALDETADWKESFFKVSLTQDESKKAIITRASKPSRALLEMLLADLENHARNFNQKASAILDLKDYRSKEGKEAIKAWMDEALAVSRMLKYFLVKEGKAKGKTIDSQLTNALSVLLSGEIEMQEDGSTKMETVDWFRWYDGLRNYLTKKPQDEAKENKLKLNFENSTLAGGWDVNKEPDNYCAIFRNQEGKQFLAISSKKNNNIFQKEWTEGRGKNKSSIQNPLYITSDENKWKKMEYDFWSDVSKMIPKCSTQLKDVIAHFKKSDEDFIFPIGYKVTSGEEFLEECRISKEVFNLNNKVFKKDEISITKMRYEISDEKNYIKSFQKEYGELTGDKKLFKDALVKWINFCKNFLSKYPKTRLFSYNFKAPEEYNSIDEFYLDVDKYSYKLSLNPGVNHSVFDQYVSEGKIYLFEIKNQDSNQGKREGHKNNLHTIYWRALFEEVANRPKLNGEAEIFYRKALPQEKMEKTKDKKGKEVIKNFRFSKEKFLFHVPITLNFCLKDEKLNDKVKAKIQEGAEIRFLGIDRGEKHLAYYSLIDQDGKIKEQGTLNLPFVDKDGKPRAIKKDKYEKKEDKWISKEVECWDYNDLLDAMASNRDMSRKNWQTIGTIKELKAGYISQIVRKIADLALRHNAMIVLEDLNTGFKRGRQKIEKSIYQKFELALAKKLNFLVDKAAKTCEPGSVTQALQLTPPVQNYQDIENRKQVGIMLYTRANYTSQTDPVTGWRKAIYLKKGSEENIKDQIIGNGKVGKDEIKPAFLDFGFDGKDYYFKYEDQNTKKPWTMYSGKNGVSLDRYRGKRGDKNEWTVKKENIVEILDGVFSGFDKSRSLREQIVGEGKELKKYNEHTAWESLRYAIELIQQIRNTGATEADNDFLQSPVRDAQGDHFDSRKASSGQPNSGDANGAYNIARKGALMAEHIKRGYSNLFIADAEWDAWLAGKEIWEKWLKENEKNLTPKANKK